PAALLCSRLTYVAATRGRDLLVVPVCGDQPIDGWLEVLNPALYPLEAAKRQSAPVPGSPSFGEESVLDRGAQGVAPPGGSLHSTPLVGPKLAATFRKRSSA